MSIESREIVPKINRNGKNPSAINGQRVVNYLVGAVKNGAIGATFDNGEYVVYPDEIVDKDGFPTMMEEYRQRLEDTGVSKSCARRNAEHITKRFDAGTAPEQYDIYNTVTDAVKGLRSANGIRNNGRTK